MPTLEDLRRDIDRVDEVLVRLLNERARCACEIGRLKKAQGVDVYQPDREKQVLDHVRGVTELVTHPGIGVSGYAWGYDWDRETRALCDPRLREELVTRGIALSTPSRVSI